VAAGGRVEQKSRIRDYEIANHAPIREVCGLTRGLLISSANLAQTFRLAPATYFNLALALCTGRIRMKNSLPIRHQN
jgi:hypothetical protein